MDSELTGCEIRRDFFTCDGVSLSGSMLDNRRDGVDGLAAGAVEVPLVSIPLLESLLTDFMLLSLSTLAVDLSFSAKEDGPARAGVLGVFEPEPAEGGLSVHIFSRSLSDSSPLALVLRGTLKRRVGGRVSTDPARGLLMRPSE